MLSLSKDKHAMPTTVASRHGNFGLTRMENAMKYATLGNTGLLVSKLCFGTMTFGDGRGTAEGSSRPSAALARLGPMNWSRRRLTAASISLIRRTTIRRVRARSIAASARGGMTSGLLAATLWTVWRPVSAVCRLIGYGTNLIDACRQAAVRSPPFPELPVRRIQTDL
jgi:hypothetical protein